MTILDDPALDRLWDALAERLQRNGMSARGVITLDEVGRDERHALAGLIGRPATRGRVRIDLAVLDQRVRATGSAPSLVAAVGARRGPLVDRKGARTAAVAKRGEAWASARLELARWGLEAEPWVEPWLEGIRPAVGRVRPARAKPVLATAVRCLARLPWDGPRMGRTDLASSVAGSSHALDDGSVLSALVLRGVAARLGEAPADTAARRRVLWELAGVLTDEVSTTVLTLGLRPPTHSVVAATVRARSEGGCETHLTLRDLRRLDHLVAPGTVVRVCENPRVLEAAMDAGTGAVVVCTAGNPVVVVTALLDRLAAEGAHLFYRGDFDWAGVAIANRVIGAYGGRPWRMGAVDYEAALAAAGAAMVELPTLLGREVAAVWDEELSPAMARAGRAIHEEALLDDLVSDLTVPGTTSSAL